MRHVMEQIWQPYPLGTETEKMSYNDLAFYAAEAKAQKSSRGTSQAKFRH
jgi:hypothetical protein